MRVASADVLDRYYTPVWCAHLLAAWAAPQGLEVLEPSVGMGTVATALRAHGAVYIWGCDLDDEATGWAFCDRSHVGVDFLTLRPRDEFELVCTNPPFRLLDRFIERGFLWAPRLVYVVPGLWFGAKRPLTRHIAREIRLDCRPKFREPSNDSTGYSFVEFSRTPREGASWPCEWLECPDIVARRASG